MLWPFITFVIGFVAGFVIFALMPVGDFLVCRLMVWLDRKDKQ